MNNYKMVRVTRRWGGRQRQKGVSVVLVAVSLVILLGFMALAVDVGNLYVARNELHNAADAGSLAGARRLYITVDDPINGTQIKINDGTDPYDGENYLSAEGWATQAAQSNGSQGEVVEVLSARRGHWSFGLAPGSSPGFTPNDNLNPVDLHGKTTEELDSDINFINAVEVVTARQQTPVETFFARVLGINNVDVTARSVAYIGFAGTLRPGDVDMPIAMCRDAIMDGGNYSCNVGRMISSNDETGGWTNYSHDLTGGANNSDLQKIMASGGGNEDELFFGKEMETVKGQLNNIYTDFYNKWEAATGKAEPWPLTLPVVDCSNGIQPSSPLVGAVEINVVWVVNENSQKVEKEAPTEMTLQNMEDPTWDDWNDSNPDGVARWNSFVNHFNLVEDDGSDAEWRQKTIYFLPSCSVHEPKGQTGGENFGILAQIPVLVD